MRLHQGTDVLSGATVRRQTGFRAGVRVEDDPDALGGGGNGAWCGPCGQIGARHPLAPVPPSTGSGWQQHWRRSETSKMVVFTSWANLPVGWAHRVRATSRSATALS